MNQLKNFIALLVVTFSISCVAGETTLNGEVFIVTKGADNIKLGGIEVAAVPEHLMMGSIEGAKPRVDKASKEVDDYMKSCVADVKKSVAGGGNEGWQQDLKDCENKTLDLLANLPNPYFDALPTSVAKTTTDANGKFSLKVPASRKYILAARGSRLITNRTEKYYWLIKVDAAKDTQQIVLSNNNQVGSDSPESAVTIPN